MNLTAEEAFPGRVCTGESPGSIRAGTVVDAVLELLFAVHDLMAFSTNVIEELRYGFRFFEGEGLRSSLRAIKLCGGKVNEDDGGRAGKSEAMCEGPEIEEA